MLYYIASFLLYFFGGSSPVVAPPPSSPPPLPLLLLTSFSPVFFFFPFRLFIIVPRQDVAKQLRDQQMVMKGHRDDALVHVRDHVVLLTFFCFLFNRSVGFRNRAFVRRWACDCVYTAFSLV